MNSKNILNELDIQIPDIVYSYDDKKQQEIYNYLLQLINDEQQKKAYTIAFQHLGSSFNIYKSNGFKEWKSKQK
jgi:ABC-type Fe2+-enterobactin transport system substrate-binding protein